MRERDHDQFSRRLLNNDAERESPQYEVLDSAFPCGAGPSGEWDKFLLEEVEADVERFLEAHTESRPCKFVPGFGLCRFSRCCGEDANRTAQVWSDSARSRRLNSSRSISSAVPASISASRLRISRSHASATLVSGGPSKLATSSNARSARSCSESVNACARSASSARFVIDLRVPAEICLYNARAYRT